jgi:predicted nuclease of restriction endonuclease-like (RecB) superfamily
MTDLISTSKGYLELLARLKSQIRTAQVRAAVSVPNWCCSIGGWRDPGRQQQEGWGAGPGRPARQRPAGVSRMQGFSPRNLKYMRAAEVGRKQLCRLLQLPWANCILLDKTKDPVERIWYVEQSNQNGWSRNTLVMQIESGLYRRQGSAITNFQTTLPAPQSDLAQQLLKDPYNFDFLTLTKKAQERDLERELLAHLRQFLIELGVGFAFVGSQVPLEVGGEDFKLDLLFYQLKLKCIVVIDLKMRPFKPEYEGKMNFIPCCR